jgi:hypothetical protein
MSDETQDGIRHNDATRPAYLPAPAVSGYHEHLYLGRGHELYLSEDGRLVVVKDGNGVALTCDEVGELVEQFARIHDDMIDARDRQLREMAEWKR